MNDGGEFRARRARQDARRAGVQDPACGRDQDVAGAVAVVVATRFNCSNSMKGPILRVGFTCRQGIIASCS
jgi:hypothetical protein